LEIQEQTFNSISQEIHDNVGQILSLTKVQLNIIEQGETLNKPLLRDAKEGISKALTDLRDIAKGLSSERIISIGLVKAIEQEAQRINRSGFLNLSFFINGIEQPIDQQKQLILFRVIQECFQNIIKHASASKVSVHINFQQSKLFIKINDNGIGFDYQKERRSQHGLGLLNISSRIELIGGSAEIISQINNGTKINLITPYV
jgi:signal transduction histidine kinase